ncbi:MAG: sugar phosphate isomerase/epimerase family protein [Bryobacteraceae bacterium]
MTTSRRRFLTGLATAALLPTVRSAPAKPLAGLRIGVTDWNLRLAGRVEAVGLAARLGFEGVEVSLGRKPVEGRLPLDDPALQERYLEEARAHKVALAGTCLDILHVNYLKNDPLGQKWVAAGIPITRRLEARVMLLPFFGKGALETQQEQDYVADLLRELAPEAEKAGVILALENTCSARENVRMLERARSQAVRVYYDVGNSTNRGYDIYEEMRWLGRERICQIHLKDKGYLGEGTIDFNKVLRIIAEIGYEGFANLETSSPSGAVEADMRRNLDYIRRLIREIQQS